MSAANQMEVDDNSQNDDLPTSGQPHYFYRLRNTDEQHQFHQSEKGIRCPICAKELKNIRMHFNNSKNCADKIDMHHFMNMYEILNAAVRRGYLTSKKQKEREKKRETDDKAFRRAIADEKEAQRRKEREEDETAHRRKRADEKQTQRKREQEQTDERARAYKFSRAVIFGPIFICSCCHRKLFENGVTKITEKFKAKLNEKKVPYSLVIPPEQEIEVNIILNGSSELSGLYICHTCKSNLLNGKMPSMAVQNGLQLTEIPDDCQLTELENNLIAQMINFQYIYQLPKSRWGATKKQMISVPVSQDTLKETISQLPRLPKDAGLVPVNLKRKKEYSNSHKKELIDPEKIMRVLQLLKDSGHPFYQFCDDFNIDTYKKRCN